tara:strand:+ start:347 stop:655 length:309 start_codon:yes stop_codon:yes gene_type:complete
MSNDIKLAEALLRRKELNGKVDVLAKIRDKDLFEVKFARKKVTEDIDDITVQVPKLTASQVTEEFDFYSKRLRLVDAAIQQANWTSTVDVDAMVMEDYKLNK